MAARLERKGQVQQYSGGRSEGQAPPGVWHSSLATKQPKDEERQKETIPNLEKVEAISNAAITMHGALQQDSPMPLIEKLQFIACVLAARCRVKHFPHVISFNSETILKG